MQVNDLIANLEARPQRKIEAETFNSIAAYGPEDAVLDREVAQRLREQEAELDERHDAYKEGYDEGQADISGWANDTANAVLQWLDKNGDGYDIHHPDGNTTDAVIQGLYDAKRIGNLEELRRLKEEIATLRTALKDCADDLEAEIVNRNPVRAGEQEIVKRRREHDLSIVRAARAALQPSPDGMGEA